MRSIFALLFIVGVVSATPTIFSSKLNNTSGNSIVEGDCTGTIESDLLFDEEVSKLGFIFVIRKDNVNYSGSKAIYCIEAVNQKTSNGGAAEITSGGINYKFVSIELVSARGHGLDFKIKIYGK
ncbi:hypothetical protein GWI33_019747 [Rhynchophorus ferrugineus]|uniref:Salivary secreted peptide n=1 Tax=Rhynchophorus ferrugineus TaxID=354439 RepID=A0A834HSY3_RHYFE|nr:hypothetical protein GWI33_019747 [Rhynchophorus ferrugineus]